MLLLFLTYLLLFFLCLLKAFTDVNFKIGCYFAIIMAVITISDTAINLRRRRRPQTIRLSNVSSFFDFQDISSDCCVKSLDSETVSVYSDTCY